MKARILIILLVMALLASGVGWAAVDSLAVSWWTVDGGGAIIALSGGDLKLQGTSGQPDAGSLSSDRFSLSGGFWNVTTSHTSRWLFLPLVVR